MADIELGVVLKADGTAFVRDVRKAKGEVGGLGKEGKDASQKMDALGNKSQGASGKVKQLGRSGFEAAKGLLLVGGAVATIAAAATGVVKTTGELDTALAGVAAVSGATTEQMSALEAQARDLGATTQFSAAEAAGAQEFLAKAGFTVDQTMQSVEGTLRLAAAGTLDLGRAADISSNILSAFGKEAGELDNVVDIMAATASRANTDVEQLGLAMQYTAPVAKAMGVSIEETSAAIGVLSNAGLQGEKAGTGLRNIFIKLASPSDRLKEILGDLSLETDGLAPLMRRLAESGLSAGEAMDIFGAEAGPAFNVLASGVFDLEKLYQALLDVDGVAEEIANKRMDTLAGDWRAFGSAVSELQIKIGRSGLMDDLRGLVQGLTDIARSEAAGYIAENLVPALATGAKLLAAWGAARLIGPALGTMADGARAAAGGITLLNASLVAAQAQAAVTARALGILSGIKAALGGPAGIAVLASIAVYQLVTAESELDRTARLAEEAQGKLNTAMETGADNAQDLALAALKAAEANLELVESELQSISALNMGSMAGIAARDVNNLGERMAEAKTRVAELRGEIEGIHPSLDAFGGAGPKIEQTAGAIDETGDSAGDAEPKLRSLAAAIGEVAEAQLAAGRQALQDIDQRIEGVIDATRTEREQIEITHRERIEAIEDAVRVERVSAEEAADLRRRVDEAYWRDRVDLERGHMIDLADLQEELWLDSLRGVRQGFVDFYGDTIREGEISWKSLWGSFKDLAIDAIAQVAAALSVNGLLKLFNIGGQGLSIDIGGGGGGGNILTSGAAAIGKKLFGGPTTTSGAGQAAASGAQTFALGPATGKIAPTAALGAGGTAITTSGLTGAGATQILTSNAAYSGGTAAAGAQGVAGLGAGTLALPVAFALGGKFLMEEVFGMGGGFTKLVNRATEDLQRAGPGVAGGLGLQTSAGDRFGFAGGANSGFAAEFAQERGIVTAEIADGLQAFRGVDMPGMIKLLDDAQAAYEGMKSAGLQAFRETGVAAEEIGVMLQDGVIDPVELARFGIEGLGVAFENPKTGVTELREITQEQFGQIARAINGGELRLEALQNKARLTGSELDVLGRIGVTAAQALGSSAAIAAREIDRITSAANSAAGAVGSIPSAPSSRSFGGQAPTSPGSHPGLAEGGVVTRRGLYELSEYNHPELVVPLSGGRAVPVEMRGGSAGGDGDTKALLRSIDARLANLQATAVLDDRSVAAIGQAVTQPMERMERSRTLMERARRR